MAFLAGRGKTSEAPRLSRYERLTMSTFVRKSRSLSTIAAAGVLAFGLAGCGAANESKNDNSAAKDETTSAAPNEEDSSSNEGSDSSSSESSDSSSDSGSDSGSGSNESGEFFAAVGTPVELDPSSFTDEDLKKGAEVASQFYVAYADGKFEDVCANSVQKRGDKYERLDTDAALKECGKMNAMFGADGPSEEEAKMMKEQLTPENLEIRPNDDGTAGVFFQGKNMRLKVIKVKDAGPLLDFSQG